MAQASGQSSAGLRPTPRRLGRGPLSPQPTGRPRGTPTGQAFSGLFTGDDFRACQSSRQMSRASGATCPECHRRAPSGPHDGCRPSQTVTPAVTCRGRSCPLRACRAGQRPVGNEPCLRPPVTHVRRGDHSRDVLRIREACVCLSRRNARSGEKVFRSVVVLATSC